MASEEMLRVWRPHGASGTLCIHGVTTSYAIDPVGECVVGVILAGDMDAHRGRERHFFRAGDLCVWGPERRHSGRPHRSKAWEARLILFELKALQDLVLDPERPQTVRFTRGPRIEDRLLTARFLRLHKALERPSSALERETVLTEWMTDLLGRPAPPSEAAGSARREPALRRACELLADDPATNVTLEQLSKVAGASRHRLTRLFRMVYGVPPHRFQLARRLAEARKLLEGGATVVEAASVAGFFDQSHLHRHFRRAFGFTPARYVALLRSDVQDTGRPTT
jgi:AraC-like DNA-binding protein